MRSFYASYTGKGRDSLLHRNLRMCTEEGIFATPFIILSIPGNIFIAALVTQVLGLRESAYGVLVSLPAWFNALQVVYIPLLARYWSARTLTIIPSIINLVFWVALMFALPHIHAAGPDGGTWLLFLLFILISISHSTAAVSWMSWVQEWIPGRLRGKYFGRRNAVIGLCTVISLAGAGYVLERTGTTVLAFQILLGVTGLMRLMSIYVMTHIYTPWSQPERQIHERWWERFGHLRANKPFVALLVYSTLLSFFLNTAGPFSPVFMTEYLQWDVRQQTLLLLLANISAALAMPFWGRLMDRHGCKPVIAGSALLWAVSNYAWAVLTPETAWLLYPMWLWGGLTSPGWILGVFNLVLKLVPAKARMAGISVHLMTTSVAAALAPVIVGNLLAWMVASTGSNLMTYRVLFVLQPTLVIAGLLLLRRVEEPQAEGLSSLVGAFRSLRQTLTNNGLVMLANMTLVRRRRKP
jgi:MFS family permease